MRRLTYLFFITFFTVGLYAQKMDKTAKKELKKAFISIEYQDFIDARERFNELIKTYPHDDEVRFGLAICKLNQKGEERDALDLIEKIYNTNDLEDYYYYLGRAYLHHGLFEEAINSLQTILLDKNKTISEDEILNYLNIAFEAKELITAIRKVEINNLGEAINTEYQESVPVMLPNGSGMYFTSRRADNTSDQKDHLGNYFQDVYFANLIDNQWQKIENCKSINSTLHDAAVSISNDGTQFLFFKTNPENIVQGDLYIADCDELGQLTNVRALSQGINSKYIESSASLSPDGSMIFFSSNRPGGYGGFDLYYAKRLPNGEWGTEVNMGPLINTAGNEDAPFFHADNRTLYFSSDGKLGLGGFDIYSCKLNSDKTWTQPENVGYPINSISHDLYYRLSENEQRAYFSSDREGSIGSDDIYMVNIFDHESFKTVIKGNVSSEEGKALNAKITIINESDRNLNGIYRTNGKGNFILLTMPMESYQLIIEADGYISKTIKMSFEDLKGFDLLEINLTAVSGIND
ncbi:MAG: PD40 domain-containing protein [Flavobacteriales bacterium]|nr:PD40 domain-containing protein [Flavobacteriales bacterium]